MLMSDWIASNVYFAQRIYIVLLVIFVSCSYFM